MHALMRTAKMVFRFGELKLAKQHHMKNMTGPRMGVLFHVHEAGSLRMGDLATKLHVAARTVTDLVDGLERDGYILRKPDPSDRRALLLELTASAKANFEKIASVRRDFVQEIFAHLSKEEQDQLTLLLSKLQEGRLSKLLAQQEED